MSAAAVANPRPTLGIYKVKPRVNKEVKVYHPKVYEPKPIEPPKVKDPLDVKPHEYKLKEYKGADPFIDPLTGLPYNYVEHSENTGKSKSRFIHFPKAIGSPVKSISRTLKMFESMNHVVDTIGGRFVELSDHRKPSQSREKTSNVRTSLRPPVELPEIEEEGNPQGKRQRRTKERKKRSTSKLEMQLDNLRGLADE